MRNVLLITADQWRGDCLSCLDHTLVQTPHLDQLAADAVLFRKHYSQSAPCGPARTSLLTGLYPMNHRSIRNGTPLDRRHDNIALALRRADYDPVLLGYTDTSLDSRGRHPQDPALYTYQGVLPGFRVVEKYADDVAEGWRQHLLDSGYPIATQSPAIYQPSSGHDPRSATVYRAQDSDSAFIADRLIDYIGQQKDKAWFAHAVFLRPHPPLFAPAPYHQLYGADDIVKPQRATTVAQEQQQHPYLAYFLAEQTRPGYYTGHPVNIRDLADHEHDQLRAIYFALIHEVDHHIGRIIEQLKRSDSYDDTLIIFTCDHGEMLGDHWLWGKGGYFDASYHVPLIIRNPDCARAKGCLVDHFTEAVDLMPTILDCLGLPIPAQCDGVSLAPFLNAQNIEQWRDATHWEFDFRDPVEQKVEQALAITSDQCTLNVLRDDDYKYVHFSALAPLFFDLRKDPSELRNCADDPAYQALVLEYAQRLLSLRMQHAERTLSNTLLTSNGPIEHLGPRL